MSSNKVSTGIREAFLTLMRELRDTGHPNTQGMTLDYLQLRSIASSSTWKRHFAMSALAAVDTI